MTATINGLHHITAISGKAHQNPNFYVNVLGLRLVKKTVNFDDPSVYHLYYGDEVGTPGTVLTFFPWEHMGRGRRGVGEASLTQFSIPPGSLPFWRERLERAGAPVAGPAPFRRGASGVRGSGWHEGGARGCRRSGRTNALDDRARSARTARSAAFTASPSLSPIMPRPPTS